jgi:hypothetical protein
MKRNSILTTAVGHNNRNSANARQVSGQSIQSSQYLKDDSSAAPGNAEGNKSDAPGVGDSLKSVAAVEKSVQQPIPTVNSAKITQPSP